MPTEIRLATPGDHETVADLLLAQLQEHGIPTPREEIAHAVGGMLRDPSLGFILVALVDGRIVGVAYLAYNWTLEAGGRVVWMEELYVDPAHRCAGIGTGLLRAALEHARAQGCVAADLEVEESHTRAANLYSREGFRPLPRRRWNLRLG
jgi:GNAT superfamily N-acetyltransferase